jgi:hypothetical protein
MRAILLILGALCLALAGETTPPPLVYVPYEKLPSADPRGAGVMLPYEEFRRLWEASQRPAVDPSKPPVGAALTAFALEGAVEGDRAVLRLSGSAVALAAGWSTIVLPPELAVSDLRSPDDRLVLERGPGTLRLHLPAPGTWSFTAEVAAPVQRDAAGGRRLDLVLPSAGSGRIDLLLPEAGAELAVAPAMAVANTTEDGRTRVRAVVGGQPALGLSWRAPVAAAAGEALILSEGRAVVTVGERSVTTQVGLDVQILRRAVALLELRLPEGDQVLAVECPGLRTWEVVDGFLRLHGHEARDGAMHIDLRLERLLPPATPDARMLQLGLPQIVGAERQTGVIALYADEGLSLTVSAHEGLLQMDPRQANAEAAVAAFRYLAPPPPLTASALRLEADLRVHLHQLVRLAADETRIDVSAELSVRRAGIFTLTAALPEGWDLVEAGGLEIDDTRIIGSGADRRLELALRSRLIGDGLLNLRFRAPAVLIRGTAVPRFPAGIFALEGARMARGNLAIAVPRSWSLSAVAAEGLAGADARAAAADPLLAEAVRGLRDDEEVALAWTWLGRPPMPLLAAAPRSRELIAHQEELITVGEGGVRRVVTWRGEVRYSAAPSLAISLPADLAATAQVRIAGLAEKSVQPGADGVATLELRFQTPLIGAFTAVLETNQSMPRLEAGKPASIALEPVTLQAATRRTVISAVARDGSLTIAASASGLDSLAAADLPPSLQGPGTIAAFRGSEPGALQLSVERHDLVELTDAAIPLVGYRAVLGDDGRLRASGTVQVNNRGRPHLELRLPADAELLEVAVDERPTRPSRRADGTLVIPLGERGMAGGEHLVRFAYEQPLLSGILGGSAAVGLQLPTVGGIGGERQIPVERSVLSLWLPSRLAVIASSGDLQCLAPGMIAPPAEGKGLTVAIPEVGTRIDLARLGDGGHVDLRLLSEGLISTFGIACAALIGGLGIWLRRRPRLVIGLTSLVAVTVLLAGSGLPAWLPIAKGCAAGGAIALVASSLSAARRWWAARRQAPAADDVWVADKP